jgi:hypothetical protein
MRLYRRLRPTARDDGLIDAYGQLGENAPSIADMQRRVAEAQERFGPISQQAGQALIELGARAAASGDLATAVSAQRQAVECAGKLFGEDSREKAIATLNLAAVHFRAEQMLEAFAAYRISLDRLLTDAASLDRLGSGLEKLLTAAVRSKREREAGEVCVALAGRAGMGPGAINIGAIAGMAFLRGGCYSEALGALDGILRRQSAISPADARRWAPAVVTVAAGFAIHLPDVEKPQLAAMMAAFAARAEAGGWSDALAESAEWRRLADTLAIATKGRP